MAFISRRKDRVTSEKKLSVFRNRLVIGNPSRVDVKILDNGNALLTEMSKVSIKYRLDALRILCNLPKCRFNRLNKALVYKLGYDVEKINEKIDAFLSSSVGADKNVEKNQKIQQNQNQTKNPSYLVNAKPISGSVYETISGLTSAGDGYHVVDYRDIGLVEVFINFGEHYNGIYKFKIQLRYATNSVGRAQSVKVSATKPYGKTVGQLYCQDFDLHGSLTIPQLKVKVLLASVFHKIPDYENFFSIYFHEKFRQRFKGARESIYKSCYRFLMLMRSSVGSKLVKEVWKPVNEKPQRAELIKVELNRGLNKAEWFVFHYSDGTKSTLNNDRYVIRNMFNKTLKEKSAFIHPMCFTPNYSRFKEHANEYCWINIFKMANLLMPNDLVPFPTLKCGYLLNCGLLKWMMGKLKKTGVNMYHYDPNHLARGQIPSYGSNIGVRLDTEIEGVSKNISTFFEEIGNTILENSTLKSDNMVLNNMISRVSNEITKAAEKPTELRIAVCLNTKQKAELIGMFPEIKFEFTEKSYSSHPLATAMRHAENHIMAKKNGFKNFIDAGGNVVSYLMNEVSDVHVCSPIVDVKDAHRHMTRANLLDKMQGVRETVTMCDNQTQDCNVEKDNLVAVQVYDMKLDDFAAAIIAHKAKRFDFSVIIPPEIVESDCDVSLFDDSIHVTVMGDTVRYAYGENGESYFHNRQELLQIMSIQIFEHNGIIFKKTLESSRKQLHFFSVVPCVDFKSGLYTVDTHYKRSESDKLYVNVPIENELGEKTRHRVKIDKAAFHHYVEYAMNTVLRLDEKSYEYILSQYRSRKSMQVKGGRITQVNNDLHPKEVAGLIGSLTAYGLRLREQAHRSARTSYYEYYAPSIYRIFAKALLYIVTKIKNYSYKFFLKVLKICTSEEFYKNLTTDQYAIYEYVGEYRFTQKVNIVGDCGRQRILHSSFENFLKSQEKMYDVLEKNLREKDDLFTKDSYDTMREIFEAGGGTDDKIVAHFDITKLIAKYLKIKNMPFSTYSWVFSAFKSICGCVERAKKYTNFCVSIYDYFREKSISLVGFFKTVVIKIIESVKSGVCKFSEKTKKNVIKASKYMKNLYKNATEDWEKSLDEKLNENSEHENEEDNDCEDSSDASYTDEDQVSEDGKMYDIQANRRRSCLEILNSVRSHISEFIHYYVSKTGRGVYKAVSFVNFMYLQIRNYLSRFKSLKDFKDELMRIVSIIFSWIENIKTKFYCNYEKMKSLYFKIVQCIFQESTFEGIIKTLSFFLVNFIFSVCSGHFSIIKLIGCATVDTYQRQSGLGNKLLGSNITASSVCDLIMNPGYFGLINIPTKLVLKHVLEGKMKTQLQKNSITKNIGDQLVAKDALNLKYVSWLSPNAIRSVLGVGAIIMLASPRLGFSILILLLIVLQYKQYLSTICIKTNIMLSYGSTLKRTNPTARLKKLREIFAKKFDKSVLVKTEGQDNENRIREFSDEEDTRVGSCADHREHVTELGYDGKEIKTPSRQGNIDSDESSQGSDDIADGLYFSHLKPCEERSQINCVTKYAVSNAMLTYPMTKDINFIRVGDEFSNALLEFYYLEASKLHIELGRLQSMMNYYISNNLHDKTVSEAIWHLRNFHDDTSLYVNLNGKGWYRLGRTDRGSVAVEGECKMTLEMQLVSFDDEASYPQFVSDELTGMFCNKRCVALENLIKAGLGKLKNVRERDIIFYNKPPGAGKTYEIVQSMLKDIKNKKNCVALTATSAGKHEIIRNLKALGISNSYKHVFTYDSILMKHNVIKADRLYCDEIFMVHVGEWLATVSLINTNYMRCYGDRNQIPYINRVPGTISAHSKELYLSFKTIDDNKSYRCPADVCYLLSTLTDESGALLYPRGVYPVGENRLVLRSVNVEPMTDLGGVSMSVTAQNLTFTHQEKGDVDVEMKRNGHSQFSSKTVHQAQGGTFREVHLYRNRIYDNDIYSNINQFIVSISRHTQVLRYRVLVNKEKDYIASHISALNNLQDYIIKEHMFKQHVDTFELHIDCPVIKQVHSRPSASHFHAINEFMMAINLNLSAYDYIHRTLLFEYHDFELPYLDDLELKIETQKVYQPGEYIVSNLLGKGERARPDTWKQALISLSKRNFAAPRINENIDVKATAQRMVENLFKAFDFVKLRENYDMVIPDLNKLNSWLNTRDAFRIGKLKKNLSHRLLVDQFQPLKFMIKGDMKPKMDTSSYHTYDPPANIIYYENMVNLFYSPLFLEIFDRITYCLNEKIIMFSGMNLDTLAELISAKLPLPVNCYKTTEIDFKMFDKSQGVLYKVYEELVYKTMKFSEEMYENIKITEYFTRYRGRCGVSGDLGAQRRTGSPNTWLSNTLVTMGILLSVYDLDDIDLLLVSGDDSLIFSKKDLGNKVTEINRDFGFEAKFLINSVPYFCSKFIYSDSGVIKVVPDAQRMFEKLSVPIRRDDFERGTVLKERFTSFKDLMVAYNHDTVCLQIDRLLCIRHNLPEMSAYSALCFIHCMFANFTAFKRNYDERFSVNI
uniref:ORF1a/b fusion protein n=2 Tax=Yam virus 1 TaxID=3123105 RepID=A0AAU6NEB7_9CLOS